MEFPEIKKLIRNTFADEAIGEDGLSVPKAIKVEPLGLHAIMKFLHTNEQVYFDALSCITGVDNGPEANSMEVIYNLYSIPFDHHLVVRVKLDRDNPQVVSISDIWKTADWHEREAYDLFGILFTGHSDLRRILLPADWEGHPLRKDYEQQNKYHGITVAYGPGDGPEDIPN